MTGMPSDDRLVVPAGSRCSTYSQASQPRPVAMMPLNNVTKMNVFDHTTGGRSIMIWQSSTGTSPTSICQNVNASGSTFAMLCSFFA